MPDIAETLATQTGLDPALVNRGLGAVLTFLKEHLGEETFEKIQSAVPQAPALISSFDSEKSSGGLMGIATDLAGRFFKGHGADITSLLSLLTKAGLSLDQIRTFLPQVLKLVEGHLPPELLNTITAAVLGSPDPEAAAAEG